MNPLLIAGAAGALSIAKDFIASKINSPQAALQKAPEAAKNAQAEFESVFTTQKAIHDLKAQAAKDAESSRPMDPKAQTAALQAFQTRQEATAVAVQQAVAAGQLNDFQAGGVRTLQAQAQTELDQAMKDGTLTVGEFRQVSASMDKAAMQIASYRFGQNAGATVLPAMVEGYKPLSMTV